jgi:hypothetical protein
VTVSLNSVPAVSGVVEPRLWTPPLRELTPESSFGFDVVEFAELIGRPLDPWQEWVVVHAGELLESGLPRFRKILIIVGRQNGKTELCVVLSLFWLFAEKVEWVLGTSTKLDYAKQPWDKAIKLARRSGVPSLREGAAERNVRRTNGEQDWIVRHDNDRESHYKIAPSNSEGGRSLTIDRLIKDELRQEHSYDSWDAAVPATYAVPDGQVWAITNQGSDKSLVLNDLRDGALSFIRSGEGDSRTALFEYSAPEGSVPTDLRALAMANPNLGRRIDPSTLLSDAVSAMERGGGKLKGFLTECMCIRVRSLVPEPVSLEDWLALSDPGAVTPSPLALSVFVGPDRDSWAVGAAGHLGGGRVLVDLAAAGTGSTAMVGALCDLVGRVDVARFWDGKVSRPAVVGDQWSLKPVLADLDARGVEPVVWSWSDVAAACAGLQDAVRDRSVRHRARVEVSAGLEGARVRGLTNGWVWDLKKSPADLTALMAVTLAHRALVVADAGVSDWSGTFG